MRIREHSQLKSATPAANLMPNVLLCIPLDHTREAGRGVLMSGQPTSSIKLPRLAPWRGYFSAAASATDQHGRQQLQVISPEHIGVSLDATGCFRRWEGPLRPTGQLSLASSQPAPGQ